MSTAKDTLDAVKSSIGLLDGLAKSKKLGLTFAFVTVCLVHAGIGETTLDKGIALGAALIAVCVYVIAQSRIEASASGKK